jgi:RHS repeat-associated protein
VRPENLAAQSVGLPAGGDMPTGLAGAFDPDEFTGAARFQLPIASSRARGLSPELALSYSSLDGQGPYGLGFSLTLPSVSRSTSLGVPRYDDRDVFTLAGQGDLVPLDGQVRAERAGAHAYTVTSYAPRLQEAFDVIERWTDETGAVFWRTVDAANVTSIYGRTPLSRIADPHAPHRVAGWLLDVSFDPHGNAILAEYLAENTENVLDAVYEEGREQTANRYPGRLRYGNTVPYAAPPFGIGPPPATDWLFDLVFDYGQYDIRPANPDPGVPVRGWAPRPDPFSSYAAGFEVRTHRLCRNLLTFHRFPELGNTPALTHAVRLSYDETPARALLTRVESIGYAPDRAKGAAAPYRTAALPPLDFGYVPFRPLQQRFQPVLDERDRPLSGLGEAPSAWADMRAEGLPGVVYADGETVLYRAPRSVGAGPVRLGPPRPLDPFPAERVVAAGTVRLIDLDGDGRLELLVSGDAETGVYPQREDGGWAPFTALPEVPTELATAASVFADLSGRGRSDLVVLTPEQVRVYPSQGRFGFGAPVAVPNTAAVTPLTPASPGAVTRFADVLGAGTTQLVRIADGSVRCWPSLGNGAFAPAVILAGAPRLGPDFDSSRLFLVDLDGSGAADVVYADGDRLRVWLNQAGNRFADPIEIPLPTAVSDGRQLGFADLPGLGAPSVLVSDLLGRRTWSCALAGDSPPHLLHQLDNHLGALTRVSYRSSVAYRLDDERAGIPWLTFLPFPVPVVASVEQVDEVSRSRLVMRYRYRHGHYDPVERRFRGFGLVERRDAERGEPAGNDGSVEARAFGVPPLVVKTWYHVGAWLGGQRLEDAYRAEFYHGDPLAYRLPGSEPAWNGAPSPDPAAHRQAAAALAGRPLRTERYGEDGSPDEPVPYDVSEQNYEVVVRQPPAPGRHGVYSVREREAFDTDYERNPADPVLTQRAVLEYDAFDNPAVAVAVDYPRRPAVTGALPEQQVLRVVVQLDDYINEAGSEPHFVGLPYQSRSLEALGITAPAGYLSYRDLADAVANALNGRDGASVRLQEWQRWYYDAADGSPAPLGASGPQQLLRRDPVAFAEQSWLRDLFAPVLSAAELESLLTGAGRFTGEADTGCWWRPGTVRSYAGPAGFYLETRSTDPFGASVTYEWDPHRIAIRTITETGAGCRDQRVRVDAFDYAKLAPVRVTDINDDVSEVLLDPLGRVIRTSRYGEESGVRAGFEPLADRAWSEPSGLTDLVDNASRLLGGAESLYYYDLDAWDGPDPRPATVARVVAQEYPGADVPPPWLTVEYADGFGRVFERKTEAEPEAPGGPRRWITSGRVRYDASGIPCTRYRPYYSDTYRSDNADTPPSDLAVLLTHDALGRPVRADTPLGVHATVARSAWGEVASDFCDTVRDSRYWAEHVVHGQPVGLDRFAGQALLKSGLAANTPTSRSLDSRGRVIGQTARDNALATVEAFAALGMTERLAGELLPILRAGGFLDFRDALTIAFQPEQPGFSLNLPGAYQPYEAGIVGVLDRLRDRGTPLTSRFGYDLAGNQTLAVDPRLPAIGPGTAVNFRRAFALDGSVLVEAGADSGTQYTVPDFRGQPVLEIDAAKTVTRYAYDALGRLSTVSVRQPAGPGTREWIAERWVYGDTIEADQAAAASANLNGRLWRVFDESGLVEYASYTLTGEAKRESRRFAIDPASPDWTVQHSAPDSPLLQAAEYALIRRIDALGRIRTQEVPGGDRLDTRYLLSGRVGATALVTAGGQTLPCVVSAAYTASGQPVRIEYGNGVVSRYGYQPLTGQLATLRATRTGDGAVLQDLTVYRDVIGNVTHLSDAAFGPLFKLPPGFDAGSDADYDALYRLVAMRGIERAGRGAAADREGGYDGLVVPWTESGVDPAGLSPYHRQFANDAGGNLYAVVHESAASSWFRQLVVSDASNRAVEAAIFGGQESDPLVERVAPASQVDAFFDPNGNQTRLPGIDAVDWTYRNQIHGLDAGAGHDRYGYDGLSNRVRAIAEHAGARREQLEVGPWRLVRESSAAGVVTEERRVRVTSGSLPVAEYRADGGAPGHLVFNLGDPLRSIVFQLGDQGALLSYEAYVPYGGTAFAIAPDAGSLAAKVERYSAQPRDRSSGLIYYGLRFLAPWTGRWASPDPAGPVDGLNLYAFVAGNPASAIDVGGGVTIELADGTKIDISPEEILRAYRVAADRLAEQAKQNPVSPTGEKVKGSGLAIFQIAGRGQLFALAFQGHGNPTLPKGSPNSISPYRLRFGNLTTTQRTTGSEVDVHLGVTIAGVYKHADPEYKDLKPTDDPAAEATRMIHLMKVKALPESTSFNNTMVPIMTISETDRASIGGLLAMTELYNIKYDPEDHTFFEAFDNDGDPHFVGAKKGGGAKALKELESVHRQEPVRKNRKMTAKQRRALHASVERFVGHLGTPGARGGKPSKFAESTNKTEVLDQITEVLVRRAGPEGKRELAARRPGPKVRVKGTRVQPARAAKQGVKREPVGARVKSDRARKRGRAGGDDD